MNGNQKGENQSKTGFRTTELYKYRGREKSTDIRTIQTNAKQRTISNVPLQRDQNKTRLSQVRSTNRPTTNQHLTTQTYKMQLDKTKYNNSNKKPPVPTTSNPLNERISQKSQNMHKTDSFKSTSNHQNLIKAQDNPKLQEVETKQESRGLRQKSESQTLNERRINEIFNTNNTQKSNDVKSHQNVASFSHYETTTHNTGDYNLPQNQANRNVSEYIRRQSIEQEKVKDPFLQKYQERMQKKEEMKENLASIGKQSISTQQYGNSHQQQPYDYKNPSRQIDQGNQQSTTNGSIFTYNQQEKKSQNTLEMKNQENEIKETKKMGKQWQGAENQNTEEEKSELSQTQKKHRQFEKNTSQGLVGLNNIGNTCFMNSILQCLLHTPALAEYFLNNQHIDELNKKAKMRGELARAYGEFVYTCKKSRNHSTVSPTQIKSLIGKYSPQFIGFAQQDSQELLRFLLDGLHEDLNRVKQKARYKELSSDARQIGEEELAKI